MLVIRLQRIGRRGHAHFRIVVQDSRQSPKSGKFVALLGSYDPHAKTVSIDKEKAQTFIKNGAQPSERVASLLKNEGVKLPKWAAKPAKKTGKTKNAEKLRKNRPAEPKVEDKQSEISEADAVKEESTEKPEEEKVDSKPEPEEQQTETTQPEEPEQTEEKEQSS